MPQQSAAQSSFVHLHPHDSVLVCLRDFEAGETLSHHGAEITFRDAIPAGHKVASQPMAKGESIIKFGCPIGSASSSIGTGEHVHVHNVQCDHSVDPDAISTDVPERKETEQGYTFRGYVRPDGRVGTRNYLAVISNVNCSASVARMIATRFSEADLAPFPNIDGVISFRHDSGCAMKWEGYRHRMLTQVLGGMAKNPNIGGFLLVGLGCEQGTLDHLVESQKLHQIDGLPTTSSNTIPVLSIQAAGGTAKTVERGVELVRQMLPQVNDVSRSEVPASKLVLGTECGGSDGYSGITANPALGAAADQLVKCGGTVILSETSEIFGAEHLLTRRARSREVAEKLLERIEWWKWYCGNYDEEFDNNPSVGNKAGGLTTITEKSLGAVSKAGTTPLEAVYNYAEQITETGFVVMDSPGFDPASVTGMVAGGANLIAFTTGRGSCFGYKPTPSFKIASNTKLFQRLPDDMDFNAGQVVEGKSVEEVGQELFQRLLKTASGEQTCSEQLGIGDEEFVPWLVGPVL